MSPEQHIREALEALGFDLTSVHMQNTPQRFVGALMYLTTPPEFEFTTFPNDNPKVDEMVVVRDISFHTLCAHHLLPFYGVAHVGYVPMSKIAGISKLARAVEFFARRPQIQEVLTSQIADFLCEKLDPLAAGVVIEAEHMCMAMRGVLKPGAKTVTSALRRQFMNNPTARAEFMQLFRGVL